jgi:hypothetical protein
VLHLGRLRLYSQTLGSAGKACQDKQPSFLCTFANYGREIFYNIWPRPVVIALKSSSHGLGFKSPLVLGERKSRILRLKVRKIVRSFVNFVPVLLFLKAAF